MNEPQKMAPSKPIDNIEDFPKTYLEILILNLCSVQWKYVDCIDRTLYELDSASEEWLVANIS